MTDTVIANAHTIKVFFHDEIRRFSTTETSFYQLCAQIQALLGVTEFTIRYLDDESDWVTIKSDAELAYAFSQHPANRALKLRVAEKSVSEKVAVPHGTISPSISSEKPWKEMKKEAKLAKKEWKTEAKEWKAEAKLARKEWKAESKLAKSPKSLYVARFVKHVTVEDGSELSPGTSFVKTWRFRNEGTIAWPMNSVLLCVGKKADRLGSVESVLLERSVMPGEEIDVSVNMTAPSGGGSYTGYWKLADPSGRKFGPRVRVQIKVVDSSSSSSDEGNTSSWGEMLSQLESMGFTNKGLNVKLLVKTRGNMDKVIRKLLKREEKMSGVTAKKMAAM